MFKSCLNILHLHALCTLTSIFILQNPGRTPNCRQIFLRRCTTCSFFIPSVEHTKPLTIFCSINDRSSIHGPKHCPPFATARITATHPLIGIFCISCIASLPPSHSWHSSFVMLNALKAANPKTQMLARPLIC